VSWFKPINCWVAKAKLDGRTYVIGYYHSEDEAGKAVSAWRAEHMPYAVESAVVG
jgi:hypothetical protein